ncbi:hypothetical protein PYCCODRAFT_1418346 [Trametes coccinea BRFM310]|uniref:Senescence domain-containing protein n=1 Tax=Trametes coccinea (strain BRFM310) TaxID=1353009 RepID=A0A1Y2ICG5_TRAC3|nr:hypothetical protein PYCCODRAFT_1418346 [Trametes coccinea BRFM310]
MIPGVTVHHVLGEMKVTLGAGDLNIVSTGGDRGLKLTVGGAAFSLDEKTKFGTLEEYPRVYVFRSDIEGVSGGYVELTLPEGVIEDGSRLSEMQTKFEEILIEHGMLQPAAEEASTRNRIKDAIQRQCTDPIVALPGVVAAHVLGEETTVLSEGTLRFDVIPQQEGDEVKPFLALTVGAATFPLFRSTTFGTLAGDLRTYVFTLEVEGANKGFVAIVLPEALEQPGADLAELQNRFELALIEYGLLKDGFEAAADEVGRSVREDSARTAQRIREARDVYLRTHPRTIEPVSVSRPLQSLASSSASGTQSVANAAHWVSGAVTSAASSAGAWIASTVVPADPTATDKLNSAARGLTAVVHGVAEGTKDVKETLQESAGDVVENDYGGEARDIAGDMGQSMDNVGAVAGNVATVTSGAALAVAGLQGAASRPNKEQDVSGPGARD